MNKQLKAVGVLLGVLVVLVMCVYAWASVTANRLRAQTFQTHSVDFPIPFPIDSAEVSSARLAPDAARQLAQERAVARGKHLIAARYTCAACHGPNFGGGVMVDAFPIGRLLA